MILLKRRLEPPAAGPNTVTCYAMQHAVPCRGMSCAYAKHVKLQIFHTVTISWCKTSHFARNQA